MGNAMSLIQEEFPNEYSCVMTDSVLHIVSYDYGKGRVLDITTYETEIFPEYLVKMPEYDFSDMPQKFKNRLFVELNIGNNVIVHVRGDPWDFAYGMSVRGGVDYIAIWKIDGVFGNEYLVPIWFDRYILMKTIILYSIFALLPVWCFRRLVSVFWRRYSCCVTDLGYCAACKYRLVNGQCPECGR